MGWKKTAEWLICFPSCYFCCPEWSEYDLESMLFDETSKEINKNISACY